MVLKGDGRNTTTAGLAVVSCSSTRQITLGSVFVTSFLIFKHGPIQPIAKASGEKIA